MIYINTQEWARFHRISSIAAKYTVIYVEDIISHNTFYKYHMKEKLTERNTSVLGVLPVNPMAGHFKGSRVTKSGLISALA